jgi:hypothetical protein
VDFDSPLSLEVISLILPFFVRIISWDWVLFVPNGETLDLKFGRFIVHVLTTVAGEMVMKH